MSWRCDEWEFGGGGPRRSPIMRTVPCAILVCGRDERSARRAQRAAATRSVDARTRSCQLTRTLRWQPPSPPAEPLRRLCAPARGRDRRVHRGAARQIRAGELTGDRQARAKPASPAHQPLSQQRLASSSSASTSENWRGPLGADARRHEAADAGGEPGGGRVAVWIGIDEAVKADHGRCSRWCAQPGEASSSMHAARRRLQAPRREGRVEAQGHLRQCESGGAGRRGGPREGARGRAEDDQGVVQDRRPQGRLITCQSARTSSASCTRARGRRHVARRQEAWRRSPRSR